MTAPQMNCPNCPSSRLELAGELAGFLLLRCPNCQVRRRADRLESLVIGSDPMGFDPDDTAQHIHQTRIDRLERREAALLKALRQIRAELPDVQARLRVLYNHPQEIAC
jgi:hypothetical protein